MNIINTNIYKKQNIRKNSNELLKNKSYNKIISIFKLKKNKKIFLFLFCLFLLSLFALLFFNKPIIIKYSSKISKIYNKHRLLEYSNNYNSYSYKKNSNFCKYFVDGKDYFQDLYEQLLEAKESIYITGLWISPELFLIRPINENKYLDLKKGKIKVKDLGKNISRLMDILDYKAKEGVKIYILLFYEWSLSLKTSSKHTENTFKNLNKNINIIRFPDNNNNILWANHEKLVIIDNMVAYVGGFDLCWGRYDNNQHPIYEEYNKKNIYEFPFIDYSNARITKISNLNNYIGENKLRFKAPRLPWHDVHARIIGPAVEDISKHFFERWNYAISFKLKDKGLMPNFKNVVEHNFLGRLKNFLTSNENENEKDIILEINEKNKKAGKKIYKKYQKKGGFMSDVLVLRSISEWNTGQEKTENSILKAYYELIQNSKHYIFIENQYFISKSWTNEEKDLNKNPRSDLIKNEISLYIRKRIEKAYENNENFKVFIFISLLNDFPGDLENNLTMQLILKHTYQTISRNKGLSLIEQLEKKMGDKWKNYIYFFSLRNHGIINGIPETEIVYVHSKLLIVDDTQVLIGSANLNDRSLLGNRDSEFAVLIEEEKEDYFLMNGNNDYRAAKFAVGLRKKLMAEHLGINIEDSILDDPVDNKLFKFMIYRAKANTKIYHDLFGCIPDDSYNNFESIINSKKIKDEESNDVLLNKYMNLKNKIVGYIVEYPLYFLKDEKLGKVKNNFSFQELLPENTYT